MKETKGIVNDRFEIIIKEFQGIVSFSYIILIILGMLFEGIYYAQFGINIFQYSGILDFLLVPFRRPSVLIILIGLSLFWYFYFISLYNFLLRKAPKFHKKFYRKKNEKSGFIKSQIKTLLILFIITTLAWAYLTSKKEKNNIYKQKNDISIEYDCNGNNTVIKGKMIGKNDLNMFLLDNDNQVQIIPLNSNIVRIIPLQ